ncbi:glycosyltransferase family 24 protein [Hydnum rufescens UP504]|uniref:Glycosyltransferase family 24 protein n=1 Tax=Hydnum rufescens UP504 TaxID=1448309 RepID=A0A9P6DT08_9AGAM|nr:glycosyltransferase family 24 protein [Hydnum rufescens UP504]
MRISRVLQCCLPSIILPFLVSAFESAPVKVWLRSSWPAPDILLEIIETVALENPDHFFQAFDVLTSPQFRSSNNATAAEVYNNAISALVVNAFFEDPAALATLELAVSLHSATPKLRAFYQYYSDKYPQPAEPAASCLSWVDWNGEKICDPETLKSLIQQPISDDHSQYTAKLLPFDHIQPSPASTLKRPLAVRFSISSKAPDPAVQYILRYVAPTQVNPSRNYLSGWGVALDLKKTDYLALDDRRAAAGHTDGESTSDGDSHSETTLSDDDILLEALKDLPEVQINADPLQAEEILTLGTKATHLIVNSPQPVTLLRQLSQNFPKFASTLARRVKSPPPEVIEETDLKRIQFQADFNGVWLDGLLIPEADLNPLGLLRLLRRERRRILTLRTLGFSPSQAVDLISFPGIGSAPSLSGSSLEGYFDASDRIEGGNTIVWWNDFEKDTRYSRWPSSLNMLMRGLYPGQFHSLRRNLNNIVLVLDLSSPISLHFITVPIPTFINRGLPFRFGVVPLVETEAARKVARLVYYSVGRFGRAATIQLLKASGDPSREAFDFSLAKAAYNELVKSKEEASEDLSLPFDSVIQLAAEEKLGRAREYSRRLGATASSFPGGHAFVNGKHFDFDDVGVFIILRIVSMLMKVDDQDFLKNLQIENAKQTQFLQEEILTGRLEDDEGRDMSVYFYDLPTTAKRRNRHVYPSTQAGSLKVFSLPDLFDQVGIDRVAIDYTTEAVPLSIWVVGDFNLPSHVELLRNALTAMDTVTTFRLSYLHTPSDLDSFNSSDPGTLPAVLHRVVLRRALFLATNEDLLNILDRISPSVGARKVYATEQAVLSEDSHLHTFLGSPVESDLEAYHASLKSGMLLGRSLGLKAGDAALIINGRLVGPFGEDGFTPLDFETLCSYELQKRVSSVIEVVNTTVALSELYTMTASVISAAFTPDPSAQGLFGAPPQVRQRACQNLPGNHSSFKIGDESFAMFHVCVILNPLSEMAQKWTPMITWLSELPLVHTHVQLIPVPTTQVPLKRFYRYSLNPRLPFDESGWVASYCEALDPTHSIQLASSNISWLVRPYESQFDLDNIHLSSLSASERAKGVEAVFDLDFLVIEGHAREASNAPPRGVQLQLTAKNSTTPIADTLVVANLGYLQFRAKPGVFQLGIRPGRGREVYEMESVGNEGWNSPSVDVAGDEVTLTSFDGLTLFPRLKRRPGMETAEVLVEKDQSTVVDGSSLQYSRGEPSWSLSPRTSHKCFAFRIKSYFGSEQKAEISKNVQAEINIFTVASGLLYERFVGIMILSVLKNTNSSVKFWFIENFLSPSFLEFIPHLAEAYGFQYELVTYKWPSWLRAQTEKQRVIWAYKILFLDVLFPMDLKKVIFVDADQIVRADLKELVDLDLQGAPYGYTPMGDDNKEMEGFRFWKTGYWYEFLRGKPYHISALYVIDLVRFRQLAAGDRLRGQYQGLSADPNSLSNLDQDLPNNMQHEIPIFSLDKDWLWCETWCSKERLDKAKTIDLCQNPLTKEPKLSRARQIPEWEKYDAEVASFAQKLVEEGKIHSHAVAASANDLASIGAGKKNVEGGKAMDGATGWRRREHEGNKTPRDEL